MRVKKDGLLLSTCSTCSTINDRSSTTIITTMEDYVVKYTPQLQMYTYTYMTFRYK